jgi:hypothetical protein
MPSRGAVRWPRSSGLARPRRRRAPARLTKWSEERSSVRAWCDPVSVRGRVASALGEVGLQVELDQERGTAPLTVRARALRAASAACDRAAERQALIDLAAACVARAATLRAPRIALAELQARGGTARSPSSPARRRQAA